MEKTKEKVSVSDVLYSLYYMVKPRISGSNLSFSLARVLGSISILAKEKWGEGGKDKKKQEVLKWNAHQHSWGRSSIYSDKHAQYIEIIF